MSAQFSHLLHETGLEEVYKTCKNPPTDEPLSRLPQTQPSALLLALHHFSLWLSSPDIILHSPRLSALSSQRLHERIHRTALKRIVSAYKLICESVGEKRNKYEAAATLVGSERPWGRVGVLRQVFGMEDEESSEEDEEDEEDEDDDDDEEESGESGDEEDAQSSSKPV